MPSPSNESRGAGSSDETGATTPGDHVEPEQGPDAGDASTQANAEAVTVAEPEPGPSEAEKARQAATQARIAEGQRYLHEAYELVPEAGEGKRWYDLPNRFVRQIFEWTVRVHAPLWVRRRLSRVLHELHLRNELERQQAWSLEDPSQNLLVPEEEEVLNPRLWVVEFFPPSVHANLTRALRQGGWDGSRLSLRPGEDNATMLDQSRSGDGWSWWEIGTHVDSASTSYLPDAAMRRLPPGFNSVKVQAHQLGSGLTAIVAAFAMNDEGAGRLNASWKMRHGPAIVRDLTPPQVENRLWTSFRTVQGTRRDLETAARTWMAKQFPGSYGLADEPQPLLNLMLLSNHDPTSRGDTTLEVEEAMRALGLLGVFSTWELTYQHLPGLLLDRVSETMCPTLGRGPNWSIWGNTETVAAALGDLRLHGNDPVRAITYRADRALEHFFIDIAVADLMRLLAARHAELRDGARIRHRKYRRKDVERLRATFLTQSLDIASVTHEVSTILESDRNRRSDGALTLRWPDWRTARDQENGLDSPPDINFREELHEDITTRRDDLLASDRAYRDIMSTVASLGSSIDSFKVQRYAIWIALLSFVIATVTLVATVLGSSGTNNLLDRILN